MNYQEYVKRYDLGTYNPLKNYVGPFWLGESARRVLSQNPQINYIAYLHDMAYWIQDTTSKEIDLAFMDAIISETGEIEIALFYHKWIRSMNFISWYSVKIQKLILKVKGA